MALLYIGTYSGDPNQGIYACDFNPDTGKLAMLGLVAKNAYTLFLAAHPNGRFVYATDLQPDRPRERNGIIRVFSVDRNTGQLTLIDEQPSQGGIPCYLTLDCLGKSMLLANYGSGSVAIFHLHQDGFLVGTPLVVQHVGASIDQNRQSMPHPHAIMLSPDNRFGILPDLGLDQIFIYQFDAAKGTFIIDNPQITQVEPGAGPRHFAFHPSGRYGYVINELNSTITAFAYDAACGRLEKLQTISSLPAHFSAHNIAAGIEVHHSGRFLYASNRGCDSIALFKISEENGTLALIGHVFSGGTFPCHFTIDESGSWLVAANQHSHSVVVFRINQKSGELTSFGQMLKVPSPTCVMFSLRPARRTMLL